MFRSANSQSARGVKWFASLVLLVACSTCFSQTNYRQGSGATAAALGQQEALQSESQMLNNLQMLQQLQQQDQLYQTQLENERLKRQLLDQQLQQKMQAAPRRMLLHAQITALLKAGAVKSTKNASAGFPAKRVSVRSN